MADDWETAFDDEKDQTNATSNETKPVVEGDKSDTNTSAKGKGKLNEEDLEKKDTTPVKVQSEMLDLLSGASRSGPQEIFDNVLEMYSVPQHFKNPDIEQLLEGHSYTTIRWHNDTQVFVAFKNSIATNQFYKQFNHPIIKLKPLSKSSPDLIDKMSALSLSPKTKPVRPEKDATVAKRLITNLIGGPVKPRTEEERKRDKEMERLRKEKREEFRQSEKAKREVWES